MRAPDDTLLSEDQNTQDTALSQPLAGKGILFIGIGFYDYELTIADELRRLGATVTFYRDLPSFALAWPVAALIHRFRLDLSAVARRHQARIAADVADRRIDYVFVINGDRLDSSFLAALRRSHSGAKFIAYYWDSLARFPRLAERLVHFDRAYTSDRGDARAFHGLRFRPLFFRPTAAPRPSIEQGLTSKSPAKYDLSFIGWLHHDRLEQIRSLTAFATRNGLEAFFYLYTGLWTYLRLLVRRQAAFVHARAMTYDHNAAVTAASRVLIDLPHPMQTGMTMRAIEGVGAGKKIITTARDIVAYDFFRPENILVIDPDTMDVDPAFLTTPPVPVDPRIVSRYSLSAWVSDVFELGLESAAAPGALAGS